MVRSPIEELQELRRQVQVVSGGVCEWAGCGERGEEMAHLVHRGMGGSAEVNVLRNVAWLCGYHHDIFDGRRSQGLREAIRQLLGGYLHLRRKPFAT